MKEKTRAELAAELEQLRVASKLMEDAVASWKMQATVASSELKAKTYACEHCTVKLKKIHGFLDLYAKVRFSLDDADTQEKRLIEQLLEESRW